MELEKVASHDPGTGSGSGGEKRLGELQLKLADVAERLRAIRTLADVEEARADARIRANLEVVKDSMVAAETAMVEYAHSAAIVTDQYVRDNVWNWR